MSEVVAPTFLELAQMPDGEREAFVASLSDEELLALERAWWFWARPQQFWTPGPERWTVACCGRGWGKNRWAVETVLLWSVDEQQTDGHMLFVGATGFDVQATMLYGKSGFMKLGERTPGMRVRHYKGRYEVIKVEARGETGRWRETCAIRPASAEVPDRIRGPDVGRAWYDELGTFKLDRADDNVWAQRDFVLRAPVAGGAKGIVSMTPKPTDAIRGIFADAYEPQCPRCNKRVVREEQFDLRSCPTCEVEFWPDIRIITGSMSDNIANLDAKTIAAVEKLRGTRLYEQEAKGALIRDVEGALFHQHTFQYLQSELRHESVGGRDTHEQRVRRELDIHGVVVAVDPSGSKKKASCESGVVVVGKRGHGDDVTAVVCDDATVRPEDVPADRTMASSYGRAAAHAAMRWGAGSVAIETNNGGDATVEALESAIDSVWRETRCEDSKPRVIMIWAHVDKCERAKFMAVEQEAGRVQYLVMHGEDGRAKWAPMVSSLTSLSPHSDTGKRDRADAVVHGHRAVHDPSSVGAGGLPVVLL